MVSSASYRTEDALPDEKRVVVDEIIERYVGIRDPILEILIKAQSRLGYLSKPTIFHIAKRLGLNPGKVYSVASFYSLLKTMPVGKRIIRVCDSPPCHVMGSGSVLDALREELGIDVGEDTADGEFRLEAVGCLGLCSAGPAMMIDGEIHCNLTREKIRGVIEYYRGKRVPAI